MTHPQKESGAEASAAFVPGRAGLSLGRGMGGATIPVREGLKTNFRAPGFAIQTDPLR